MYYNIMFIILNNHYNLPQRVPKHNPACSCESLTRSFLLAFVFKLEPGFWGRGEVMKLIIIL